MTYGEDEDMPEDDIKTKTNCITLEDLMASNDKETKSDHQNEDTPLDE